MSGSASWYYPPTFPVSVPQEGAIQESNDPIPSSTRSVAPYDRHLASFIFLVSGLEKSLNDSSPILFDGSVTFSRARVSLGSGHSFVVERAEWNSRTAVGLEANQQVKWGKAVALKYVIHTKESTSDNWRDVLLEMRALLHEPIRYHPNIVRLLGLTWGATEGARSMFPVLVLEYAEYGSLRNLQTTSEPLSFAVKKKLCHDVSKGLSILHACGIVHGDLKHENVLVYKNKNPQSPIPYTAKLADFGGSVMDLDDGGRRALHMRTKPFNAPEFQNKLGAEGLKLTDVYSLGLLIWRTFIDGIIPFDLPAFSDLSDERIEELKAFDQVLDMAKASLREFQALSPVDMKTIEFLLEQSLQAESQLRNLTLITAALQATELLKLDDLLRAAQDANELELRQAESSAPGSHGITTDSLGVFIAKSNYGDYDFQHAGPGHRPKLSSPNPAEFLFDIARLKGILDWNMQKQVVQDLEYAASATSRASSTQISRVKASFALFQSYIHEFGVVFNAERACHWLKAAAESDDECEENYLAQAWCWRVHQALGVTLGVPLDTLKGWIHLSVMRGHRQCIQDSDHIVAMLTDGDEEKAWSLSAKNHKNFLDTLAGGVGMPYFLPRKLRRQYDLNDLKELDKSIQAEFTFRDVKSLDDIFVNHRGDGLLHMAASLGKVEALTHLLREYKPNIDIANKAEYDTPLLSACRGGHLNCALLLLEVGANPNGSEHSRDPPLSWLCAFSDLDVPIIAQRLVDEGASLKPKRTYRSPLRSTWADPEYLFVLPASPFSRAVMMENLPAVRALLALGADPLDDISTMSSTCPLIMAAVLTMPRILEVILQHVDVKEPQSDLFDELEMLQISMDKVATVVDPTSLLSRLARRGAKYHSDMFEVLKTLRERSIRTQSPQTAGNTHRARAANTSVARLVSLGRVDIVDSLLRLGIPVTGQPFASPLVEAVKLNHDIIFRMLIGHGADPFTKTTAPSGSHQSLIQLVAERPAQSRPGTFIPEYLLKVGVPVDPLPDGSPSAFVSAVRNQDFELANLLRSRGADIDFEYLSANVSRKGWATVFRELVGTPHERHLESVRYLLGKLETSNLPTSQTEIPDPLEMASLTLRPEKRQKPKPWNLPNHIVDKEDSLSVLHVAATIKPHSDTVSHTQQQILSILLSEKAYTIPGVIDMVHPVVGTALISAAAMENFAVVQALIEKKADVNVEFGGYTVLDFAGAMRAKLLKELDETTGAVHAGKRSALRERLRKLDMIVELLVRSGASLGSIHEQLESPGQSALK